MKANTAKQRKTQSTTATRPEGGVIDMKAKRKAKREQAHKNKATENARADSELRAIADAMVATEIRAYEAFHRDRMRAFHAERGGEWIDAFHDYDEAAGDAAYYGKHGEHDGSTCEACAVMGEFWELHDEIYEGLTSADMNTIMGMVYARMDDEKYRRMAGVLAMNKMRAEEAAD